MSVTSAPDLHLTSILVQVNRILLRSHLLPCAAGMKQYLCVSVCLSAKKYCLSVCLSVCLLAKKYFMNTLQPLPHLFISPVLHPFPFLFPSLAPQNIGEEGELCNICEKIFQLAVPESGGTNQIAERNHVNMGSFS